MVPPINDNSLMPFGKYKGTKMVNVPAAYLKWLIENATNLRPDLKAYLDDNLQAINQELKSNNRQIRR
jgi:uncharacterized protein (DUF3820 family)